MKDTNLKNEFSILYTAKCPEDVFGDIPSITQLNIIYRKYAAQIHPDVWMNDIANKTNAEECFKLLGQWNEKAVKKLQSKKYGDRSSFDDVVITTKKNIYTINQDCFNGDISKIYGGYDKNNNKVFIKIVKNVANNDLVLNEYDTLNFLWNDAKTKDLEVMKHVRPNSLETFEFQQGKTKKRAIVFTPLERCYTLEDVIKAYPNGLDIRDVAWMWNRLLGALMIPSQCDRVHGAIVPNNFLIFPETHNGILIDWSFSVKSGENISAISSLYKEYYPKEAFNKTSVDKSTDIYMAALCFLKLIGGDVEKQEFPVSTPKPISGLIRACLLSKVYRIKDVFGLYNDFQDVLESLYGKRKFREFSMPKK